MRTGHFVVQLEYAEQSVELEAENWRLRKQFEYAESLASWTMRTGDFVVQL